MTKFNYLASMHFELRHPLTRKIEELAEAINLSLTKREALADAIEAIQIEEEVIYIHTVTPDASGCITEIASVMREAFKHPEDFVVTFEFFEPFNNRMARGILYFDADDEFNFTVNKETYWLPDPLDQMSDAEFCHTNLISTESTSHRKS